MTHEKMHYRKAKQNRLVPLVFSAILLILMAYLTWDIFFRPTIDYQNWEKSYDNISWYGTRFPYYTYDMILPDLYFKSTALVPPTLVNGKLIVRFRGCIYEVSVNGKSAYSNPLCNDTLKYDQPRIDERIISLAGLVKPGQNELKFQFVEKGGTMWFELGGGKENNLLRYVLLVFLSALFVYCVTGRSDLLFAVLALSIIPLHLFTRFFPFSWGFEALDYYPIEIKTLFIALCLPVCIPFLYRWIDYLFVLSYRILRWVKTVLTHISRQLIDPISKPHAKLFFELSYIPRCLGYALISSISFAIFWLFRTKHSLGDQGFIGQIATSNNVHTFFSTSPLSAWFLTYVYSILKSLGVGYTSYEISSLVACLYGAIAVPVLWETCKELAGGWKRSLAIFSIVATSYYMVLFFGYIEFYPALLFWMMLYVYVSILYLNDKVGISIPSFFFALMFCMHLSSGFIGPSLLLLPFLKVRKLWGAGFIRAFAVIFLTTTILISLILGHVIFVYKGPCNDFKTCVTTFSNSLKGSDASFFRPDLFTPHFAEEIINEYLQVSPAAIILLVFLLFKLPKINLKDNKLVFLASVTFLFGMYTILHYTGLGFPQDWDVLAPIGFPLTLLVSYVLVTLVKGGRTLRYYVVAVVAVSFFIHTMPMIIHDADMIPLLVGPQSLWSQLPFGHK